MRQQGANEPLKANISTPRRHEICEQVVPKNIHKRKSYIECFVCVFWADTASEIIEFMSKIQNFVEKQEFIVKTESFLRKCQILMKICISAKISDFGENLGSRQKSRTKVLDVIAHFDLHFGMDFC